MAQLSDVLAIVGNAYWPVPRDPIEEVPLHGVIVQRPVDVHRADGGPTQPLRLQELLALQLLLMPGVGISRVLLAQRQHVRGPVHPCAAHQKELLAAPGCLDALHKRLDLCQLAHVVVEDQVKFSSAGDCRLELLRVLPVGNQHRHALQHLLIIRVGDAREAVRLASIGLATVADHHVMALLPELGNQIAADEAGATHHQATLLALAASGTDNAAGALCPAAFGRHARSKGHARHARQS
mmetsp:Transcript_98505/g.234522  ORF Transcript_98505/g.234522 Transcript_98505/m.234522 type:complete len:239 (+) Transcript_98505:473-1189(+)